MIRWDGRLGAGSSDWLLLKLWQHFVLGFNHFIVIKDVHYVISAAGPLIWNKADVLFMPLCLPSFLSDSIISTGSETGWEDWNNIFSWFQFESCQIKKARDTIFHHPHSAQTFQQLAAVGCACKGGWVSIQRCRCDLCCCGAARGDRLVALEATCLLWAPASDDTSSGAQICSVITKQTQRLQGRQPMTGRCSSLVSCQRSFGSVASFASSGFTAELLFQCVSWRLTSPPAPPGHLLTASAGVWGYLPVPVGPLGGSVPSYQNVLAAHLRRVQWGCTISSRVLQTRFTELEKLGAILCSRGVRHVTTAWQPHRVTSQHWFLPQTSLPLLLFTEQKPPPWGPASSRAPTCPPLTAAAGGRWSQGEMGGG